MLGWSGNASTTKSRSGGNVYRHVVVDSAGPGDRRKPPLRTQSVRARIDGSGSKPRVSGSTACRRNPGRSSLLDGRRSGSRRTTDRPSRSTPGSRPTSNSWAYRSRSTSPAPRDDERQRRAEWLEQWTLSTHRRRPRPARRSRCSPSASRMLTWSPVRFDRDHRSVAVQAPRRDHWPSAATTARLPPATRCRCRPGTAPRYRRRCRHAGQRAIASAGCHLVEPDVAGAIDSRYVVAVDRRARREQIDSTSDVHACFTTLDFDLAPCVVRESGQFDVVRGVIAVADDPAVIVRGTVVMTAEIESLEADHGLPGRAANHAVALPIPPRPMTAMS